VVLGLATGPFRVLEPDWPATTDARIDEAERWVAAARRRARGTRLALVSVPRDTPHPRT